MKYVLLALKLILLSVFVFFAVLLIGTKIPLPIQYQIFSVQSGSMEPEIPVGSAVVVKSQRSYAVGDIITFSTNQDLPTTHRIVSIEEWPSGTFFTTKGDANNSEDFRPVEQSAVLGSVALTMPFVGYAASWLHTQIGFVVLIIIPATIIIYEELRSIKGALFTKNTKLALFVLILLGISSVTITQAGYVDEETITNNFFGASNTYGQTASIFVSDPYTCSNGATNTSQSRGEVTIDFDDTHLYLSISLEGALPNATYDVWVNQNPGACPLSQSSFPAALTTNVAGEGHENFTINKEPGATQYWISAVSGSNVLRSTSVE